MNRNMEISPFSFLLVLKLFEDSYLLLQRAQPGIQCLSTLWLVIRQLSIEVFLIRRCWHGRTENRLHEERMMWFQSVRIRGFERGWKLVRWVREAMSQSLRCEVQPSISSSQCYVMSGWRREATAQAITIPQRRYASLSLIHWRQEIEDFPISKARPIVDPVLSWIY